MELKDRRGLTVSSHNPAALERFETALDLTASYFIDPLATITAAIEHEPSSAIAHCLRAALGVMSTERGAMPMIAESIAVIEAPATRANARERMHAAAARAWLDGNFARAVQLYGDIVVEYPRDLLAVQTAHVGDFSLGQSTMLRDRIAQVLPHWSADVPGYGYVLGMHAFGLEETALYERAEDTGRLALELNRRDPWAVHAVAHVMEMQGRVRDGIEWLTSREPDWSIDNGLSYHNWWHLALHSLELGDHRRALELYDTRIRPTQTTSVALEMVDASAMLWRLTLRGVDVGSRWQALAQAWLPLADDGLYSFNDVHATLAFVGSGDLANAERMVANLERAALESGTNGMMAREVGLPLARAIVAFGREQYAEAVDLIAPMRVNAQRFGGSHAQRDIVHLTLVEAALRAGRSSLAFALAAERTNVKRTSPFNWRLSARALELQGQADAARRARETADVFVKTHQPMRSAAPVAA
jgi:tetratricopeptide (TPR) repeat protein